MAERSESSLESTGPRRAGARWRGMPVPPAHGRCASAPSRHRRGDGDSSEAEAIRGQPDAAEIDTADDVEENWEVIDPQLYHKEPASVRRAVCAKTLNGVATATVRWVVISSVSRTGRFFSSPKIATSDQNSE